MKTKSLEQVVALLRKRTQPPGTQTKAAKELGVSVSYINAVVSRNCIPGRKLLSALGLERRVVYVKKK